MNIIFMILILVGSVHTFKHMIKKLSCRDLNPGLPGEGRVS